MINMKALADSDVRQLIDMTREKVIRHGLNWLARAGLRRIPVVLWRGTARTGQAGRLLVAGDDPWVRYLPQRFFEGESTCEPIGRVAVRALPRLVEEFRKSIDMAVLRIDRLSHSKVFPSGYLVVPEWVGTKLLVPDDINALVRSSSNIARDVRRVRSRKFEPMVSSDGQGLDRFYQSFYLPLSKARYGQLLIVRPICDLRRRLRRGGIL